MNGQNDSAELSLNETHIKDLNEYDFGKAPKWFDPKQIEYREELTLEEKARYVGEWIIGTNTRQGKGRIIW